MAENRNYWAVGTKWDDAEMLPEFVEQGYWADGYGGNDDERYKTTLSNVKIGDVFLAKSSFTIAQKNSAMRWKNVGIVIGKEEWYRFKMKWLYANSFQEDIIGRKWYSRTIEQINDENTLNYAKQKIKNMENSNQTNRIVDLLAKSKNLILTGAPGVGKTYTTAEIAVAIVDGTDKVPANRSDLMKRYKELINSGQIVFTTFHQSLDYEEFVEGLKPIINEQEGVTYSVEAGIFKKICQRAKEKSSIISLESALEKLKEECSDEKNNIKAKTVTGAKFAIKYNDGNSFYLIPDNSKSATLASGIPINIGSIKKIYELSTEYDIFKHPYSIQKDYPIRYPGYLVGILNYLEENHKVPKYKADISEKNFVLIIDEINRGNISKIFGELITLLEKDKRLGTENEITVTLPYSQEKFRVPSSLHIIGTMNTADRSIGTIDYALRRRFAFVSLKSDKNVISTYDKYQGDTKTKAENLFDAIKTFIESNINEDLDADDLMAGHSYFLCETEEDLKCRLEYEITPLLWEYQKDGILTCDRETLVGFINNLSKLFEIFE